MLFRWRCVIQVRGPALSLAPPVLIISEGLVRGAHRNWGQWCGPGYAAPPGGSGQFGDFLNYEPTEWAREFLKRWSRAVWVS